MNKLAPKQRWLDCRDIMDRPIDTVRKFARTQAEVPLPQAVEAFHAYMELARLSADEWLLEFVDAWTNA